MLLYALDVCQIGRPTNQLSPADVGHLHKGYDSYECNHGISSETVPRKVSQFILSTIA